MRILFLTNFYPPSDRGGYEQWCREVAVELGDRGHQVCVLTSSASGPPSPSREEGVEVYRLLQLEVEAGAVNTALRFLFLRKRLERENLRQVRHVVDRFRPELALIWGMWNVPRSVPAMVEQLLPGGVAYYLCDYWPSLPSAYLQQLRAPARQRLAALPKRLIGRWLLARFGNEPRPSLRLERPLCVSQAVRKTLVQVGAAADHAAVIHGGIRWEGVSPDQQLAPVEAPTPMKLLYAGRLSSEKGVHTAIRALALTAARDGESIALSIVGAGSEEYERELRALVAQHHLSARVTFHGAVPHSEMPRVLSQYDALVFPSEWEEPFARIVLEAMASGVVVIGTTTGGTGEVLVHEETGLTFPPGNALALAAQIYRLQNNPALRERLVAGGRQRVMQEFTFIRMVDRVEAVLDEMAVHATG